MARSSRDQPRSSRGNSNSRYNNSSSSNSNHNRSRHNNDDYDDDSAPIDPSKPQWWNEQKKNDRRQLEQQRHDNLRAENERRKIAAGNVVNYSRGANGSAQIQDGRVGASRGGGGGGMGVNNNSNEFDRKSNRGSGGGGRVGAFNESGRHNSEKSLKKMNGNSMDIMDMHDDRLGRGKTADEELEGRSIWDLVDRGTLMVGCCLILIVIIAVTIPVALISEDEPYVHWHVSRRGDGIR